MTRYNQIGKLATTITNDGVHTIVTYHSTQVVEFNDDEIILKKGGYETNTTKIRMNQTSNVFSLGYQVYQKDYAWYVSYKGEELEFFDDAIVLERW